MDPFVQDIRILCSQRGSDPVSTSLIRWLDGCLDTLNIVTPPNGSAIAVIVDFVEGCRHDESVDIEGVIEAINVVAHVVDSCELDDNLIRLSYLVAYAGQSFEVRRLCRTGDAIV